MPLYLGQWSALSAWIAWTLNYKTVLCTHLYSSPAGENLRQALHNSPLSTLLLTIKTKLLGQDKCIPSEKKFHFARVQNVTHWDHGRNSGTDRSMHSIDTCLVSSLRCPEAIWVSGGAIVKPTCVMYVAQHFNMNSFNAASMEMRGL